MVGAGTRATGSPSFRAGGFTCGWRVAQRADRAQATIEKSFDMLVEKSKLAPAARDAALIRVVTTTTLDTLADADYIVEAIVEQAEGKRALFARLDALAKPAALLASNTSSISITVLGAATKRPDKVLGMHFMNRSRHDLVESFAAATSERRCRSRGAVPEVGKPPGSADYRDSSQIAF